MALTAADQFAGYTVTNETDYAFGLDKLPDRKGIDMSFLDPKPVLAAVPNETAPANLDRAA